MISIKTINLILSRSRAILDLSIPEFPCRFCARSPKAIPGGIRKKRMKLLRKLDFWLVGSASPGSARVSCSSPMPPPSRYCSGNGACRRPRAGHFQRPTRWPTPSPLSSSPAWPISGGLKGSSSGPCPPGGSRPCLCVFRPGLSTLGYSFYAGRVIPRRLLHDGAHAPLRAVDPSRKGAWPWGFISPAPRRAMPFPSCKRGRLASGRVSALLSPHLPGNADRGGARLDYPLPDHKQHSARGRGTEASPGRYSGTNRPWF